MRRLLLLAGCSALLVPLFVHAEDDPDPEPAPNPDLAIQRLDDAVTKAKDKDENLEKQRKQLVARLERTHAVLVKRNKEKEARELKDRILLADSLLPGHALETKLTVPKLLEKASSNGKYRELLHVLYVPQDKASYNDFSDYGPYQGNAYAGYNNLSNGNWVYVYPRWYIWKN